MRQRPWRLPEQSGEVRGGLPRFLADVLRSRGLEGEAARQFLEAAPPLSDPMAMRDMAAAAQRVCGAVAAGERILIFGDFDCDGITATVLLYDYLERCGADVLYYIPERETEGYGLSKAAVDRAKAAGVRLLITVDNGIAALEEAAYAKEQGLDLLITDHHIPREQLPQAVAVLDPHRADCPYPNRDLCGAAVAFMLVCAMEGEEPELLLEQYGDLVVLATLADSVPLVGENRTLVKLGMKALAETRRPGLLALAEEAGLDLGREDTELVTFGLAPRINVTGRIGSVDLAVELLLCEDEERAAQLAGEVNRLNGRRREMEAEVAADIKALAAREPAILHQRVLVFAGRGWHRGIIGITAARMAERYGKPCIILSTEDGEARGSARSVGEYDMIAAIHRCGGLLTKYGGHPMAAGLTLPQENVEAFTRAILQDAAERYPHMPLPTLDIDAVLSPEEATLDNIHLLQKLAPFGQGNPQPVLALLDQPITAITPMGGGNHLRLGLGGAAEAVLFGIGPGGFPFGAGERVDCAVTLHSNVYNGQERPQMQIAAVRPAGFDAAALAPYQAAYEALQRGEEPLDVPPEDLTFTREDLSVVYRFLRRHSPCPDVPEGITWRLGGASNHFRVLAALDTLRDLDLITQADHGAGPVLEAPAVTEKSDLGDSATFQFLQQRLVK